MRFASPLFFFVGLLVSQLSFAVACPSSNTSTATGAGDSSNCTVTGSASTIQLNFITGFNSSSFLAPSGGNNGTAVGAQRKLSFIKAAEILADRVSSSQVIIMDATFTGLACSAGSATLGSAGATISLYHPAAPAGLTSNTWYPVGLYNDISNSDQLSSADDISGGYSGNGTGSDINSRFNSNIGQTDCLQSSNGWYYGFDAPPSNYIGFTTVLLHEATHGLGFASLTSASTGAKNDGRDDIFSNNLYSLANGASWSGLSDGQRASSAISLTGLLWNGSNVNAQAVGLLTAGFHDADSSTSFTSGDRVQMYAPSPIESGSSVSHFNTAASPNEIMEPEYTAGQLGLGLALYLLKDIGWDIVPAVTSTKPTIEVAGSTHNDGDTFILSDNSTQINVNNGSGNYSYSLDYNSSNVTGLIAENTAGLTIGLPATGEFAGDYTLTITDNGDGDVVTLIVTRPLRLSWSTKALLNDDMSQTLKVEGGAAGTVYSIVQSGSADLIFRDGSGASITTATAANDAEAFNSAMVQLDSLDVADISYMDVTVQSSYEDVIETDVKVYPSSLHHFTVENDLNEALVGALATLDGNELLLRELNLVNNFSTDTHGEFTVLLPDTSVLPASESYAMTISATGYTPATLVLSSENTAHKVVLTELVNGISINGEISAGGNQNLLLQVPVVIITYDDGTTEAIAVSVSLATQASFSLEVDLNAKSLSLLSISQAESVTVDLDMSNVSQSQNLEVFLLNNISVVATRPVDTGDTGSAAGGSLIWFNLFLFGVLLASRLLLKRAKMKVCI